MAIFGCIFIHLNIHVHIDIVGGIVCLHKWMHTACSVCTLLFLPLSDLGRSFHVKTPTVALFFVMATWCTVVWWYHNLFSSSLVDGWKVFLAFYITYNAVVTVCLSIIYPSIHCLCSEILLPDFTIFKAKILVPFSPQRGKKGILVLHFFSNEPWINPITTWTCISSCQIRKHLAYLLLCA